MLRDENMHKTSNLVPALFLHIQKTAGTSIVDLAREHYGAANVVSHGDYLIGWKGQSLDEIVSARGGSPEDFKSIPFVSGHFGYDFARALMDGRYSFTFLRNPVERILSYYYFCRTRDPREYEIYALSQKLELDEFLEMAFERPALKACIWNNQTWQLANGYGNLNGRNILSFTEGELLEWALDHLRQFTYIGISENFEYDRDNILRALGIAVPAQKVVSNANPGRPLVKDLPASTRRLLEDLTGIDQVLYKEAQALRTVKLSKPGLTNKLIEFGKSMKSWLAS